MRPLVIAIDGPSGSGKSSTSRGVAERLHLRYVDTGAMYRAMTWSMLDRGVDVDDAEAVADACAEPHIVLRDDPADPRILVDGRDVSVDIRGKPVADAVSRVAAVPRVRARLVDQQRNLVATALSAGAGVVVEGRDIGTVVLPDADLKVYLTADAHERAARRAREQADRLDAMDVDTARDNLAARDALDTSRAISPLQQAPDAVAIDGTHLTLEQVIDAVVAALPADRS